jgi:hypothetical protein
MIWRPDGIEATDRACEVDIFYTMQTRTLNLLLATLYRLVMYGYIILLQC